MTAYTEIAVYMVVVNVSTCVFSKLDLDVAGRFINFPLKKIKNFNIIISLSGNDQSEFKKNRLYWVGRQQSTLHYFLRNDSFWPRRRVFNLSLI